MRRARPGGWIGFGFAALLAGCVAPGPSARITGQTWLAEEVGGQGVGPRVQSTLRLDSDGQASGSAGCNRFTAPARLTGDEIHLGPFATTRRLCPPEVMDQEDRYLAALAAARRFGLEGEVLRLRDEDDGELQRFIVTAAPE
jgi:putative lipoprotein